MKHLLFGFLLGTAILLAIDFALGPPLACGEERGGLAIPPPSFISNPIYSPTITVEVVSGPEALRLCSPFVAPATAPVSTVGCALWPADRKTCTIYVREDVVAGHTSVNLYDLLLHEFAHCYGWPADHPDFDFRLVPSN